MPTLDLTSKEYTDNPYPFYDEIRTHGDIVWDEVNQVWLIPSDRLCRKIMSNFAQSGMEGTLSTELFGEGAFIVIDDKRRHDALRAVWEVAFRNTSIKHLTGRVEEMVDGLLAPTVERLKDGETVDVIKAFCRDLPVQVISEMFGVSHDMRPLITKWSDDMMASIPFMDQPDAPETLAAADARANLARFLYDEVSSRRKNPTDDLIGQIVGSEIGKTLSDDDLMVNCRQLLFAGNETTARWLAQGIFTLGTMPDELAAVSANPSAIPATMEEVMRWDSIAQYLERRVKDEPVELGGVTLAPGSLAVLLVGAANRDPARYDAPNEFNTKREQKGHLSFGFGMHHCLGAALARLEVAIAMPRLLKAVPHYVLDGPATYSHPMTRSPDKVGIRLS